MSFNNEIYLELMRKFLEKEIDTFSFRKKYQEIYLSENFIPDKYFDDLDKVFCDAEMFSTDNELIDENPGVYLNEKQLMDSVFSVYSKLSNEQSILHASTARPTS